LGFFAIDPKPVHGMLAVLPGQEPGYCPLVVLSGLFFLDLAL
jgi:hypothetical protein